MADSKKKGRNNKSLQTETVTIASGASLSGAIDVGTRELVGILMPAAWTAADITFACSIDNTTFNKAMDAAGNEVSVTAPAANDHILLNFAGIKGLFYLKIRSGTAAIPVVQAADRVITLVLKEE